MRLGGYRSSFLYSWLLFLISTASAHAAMLRGTVLDPKGANVPGAQVRLLDPQGAEVARTETDTRGEFRFPSVAAATYTVEVSLAGFGTTTAKAIPGQSLQVVLPLAPVHENIIVTATRTEANTGEVGASTSVLTRDRIVNRDTPFVSDLLQSLPGIAVVRNGAPGAVTSLFAQGGDSDYNKVLLDGIPLNAPGGDFDFSTLTTNNLERIEVVRGAESALFGSDAMTSVIQLFTRRGSPETKRPHFSLSGEGGKNSTWQGRGSVTGEYGPLDYSLEGGRFSTDNQVPNNFFHVTMLSSNFGLKLNQTTTVRLIMMGAFSLAGTPGQTVFGPPDLDGQFRRRDGYGAFSIHNQTTASWDQQLTYTYSRSRQISVELGYDPPFTPSFDGHTAAFPYYDYPFNFLNDAWRDHASYQSNWEGEPFGGALGQHVDTFAFDWDREHGFLYDRVSQSPATRALRDNFGYTFQDQTLWGRFSLGNGVRIEDNGSFGTVVVPRSSLVYLLRKGGGFLGATRLKFNFGLGVKEPSFLQSFSNTPFFVGNPNLAPERARSLSFGLDQGFWHDRGKLELDAFDNRFRDQIAFEVTNPQTYSGTYFNIGRAKAQGAEVIVKLAPLKGLQASGSYTYLNSEVLESGSPFDPALQAGRWLLRRPRHSGSVQIDWNWRKMNLTSTTVFVGRRVDSDFLGMVPPIIWNSGYTSSDLAWSYRSDYHLTYYGLVENLLNQKYMEVLGYPALKRTFRAGIRVEF